MGRGALAEDDCKAGPKSGWKTAAEIDQLLTAQGYVLHGQAKEDDGCYEVDGKTIDGKKFEAKVNPATGTIVKMKTDHD